MRNHRAFVFSAVLCADTLKLKNGSTIEGRFLSGDTASIKFAVGNDANTYDLVDIESLAFTPRAPAYQPVIPRPVLTQPALLGPGAQLAVRLIDSVDSKRDRPRQTYRASMEQPVQVNGGTVIPRGADCIVVLRDEQQSRRISGRSLLTIALRSVNINGRNYDLATSTVSRIGNQRGVKSGEVIGGTTALGAIVGALAGGGRGAAIGATSGAGLGTAVQLATSGERVRIPSETVLVFTLENAVYLP
jgi:hypothetical protein